MFIIDDEHQLVHLPCCNRHFIDSDLKLYSTYKRGSPLDETRPKQIGKKRYEDNLGYEVKHSAAIGEFYFTKQDLIDIYDRSTQSPINLEKPTIRRVKN